MYQQHCEIIEQALQSESELDMYDIYQVCLSGAVESDTRCTAVVGDVRFTPNLEPLKLAITCMGEVDVTVLTGQSPVLHEVIDMKDTHDMADFDPSGVLILTVNGAKTLVIADHEEKSLKSVHFGKERKTTHRLKLCGWPYSLAKIKRNEVASTVWGSKIVLAQVNPEVVLISNVKTIKQYQGLCLLPDSTFVAGSNVPPAVDILDLKGNVLRSLTRQNTGLNLITEPRYLCTSHLGNILVSDSGSKSVYSLTSNGAVIFSFKPSGERELRNPLGIAATNTGDILLADSKSYKIIQLAPDGTFARDVLTSANGIRNPWGLKLDETHKLYICQRGVGSESIKVFRFA